MWTVRRRAAVERLTSHPHDLEAALRLSRVLAGQATFEAQESYTAAEPSCGVPYHEYLAACLGRLPDMASAEALARKVTAAAPDPHLRARGWAHLVVINQSLNRRDEAMRCLREAVREDPARFEGLLRAWTQDGGS